MNINLIISTERVIFTRTFKLYATKSIRLNVLKRDNTIKWKGTDPILVFLFGDSAYPLLPFIMTDFKLVAIFKRKVLQLCACMTIQNSFGKKASLKCLRRAMDININTLPQVLYLCLALHNYFELRKEKYQNRALI